MSQSTFLQKTRKVRAGLETELEKFSATFDRIDFLRAQADAERRAWEETGDPERLRKSAAASGEAETLSAAIGDVEDLKERVRTRFFEDSKLWDALAADGAQILDEFLRVLKAEEKRVADVIGCFIVEGGDPSLVEVRCAPQVREKIFGVERQVILLREMRERKTRLLAAVNWSKNPHRRTEKDFDEAREVLEAVASELSTQ